MSAGLRLPSDIAPAAALPGAPTVYLDSSDFSKLSAKSLDASDQVIRDQLIGWAVSGEVRFVYSMVHISEMAPLESRYTPAAAARTDLLVSLCGHNTMISFDRLLAHEWKQLDAKMLIAFDPISSDGRWFPEVDALVDQAVKADIAGSIRSELAKMPRAQRRLHERKLNRKGTVEALERHVISSFAGGEAMAELQARYPMRPENAEVLARYVLGRASKEDASAAFESSLRDPRWLMRWFAEHHATLGEISAWIRDSSQDLRGSAGRLLDAIEYVRAHPSEMGESWPPSLAADSNWNAMTDLLLARVVESRGASSGEVKVLADDIRRLCPGFTTFVQSILYAIRDATTATPRMPKNSDMADGAHASYAPYVDVLRADAYMAPHIARSLRGTSTEVVPRLAELLPVIRGKLQPR